MNAVTPACRRLLFAAAYVLLTLAPVSQAHDDEASLFHTVMDVAIDADGRVLSIEPVDNISREIADFLREQVDKWQFLPGALNGRPAPTRTAVVFRLEATGGKAGRQFEVRIVDAFTGPRYAIAKAPHYPPVALDRRETGEVLLRVDFDEDGRVLNVAVEKRVGRPYFDRAARDAVLKWTFQPERVGDIGIPATVFVPVRFCIQGLRCKSLPVEQSAPTGDGPRLVGEPAAKIIRRGAPG